VQDVRTVEGVREMAQRTIFQSASMLSTGIFQVLSLLSGAVDGLSRVFFLVSIAQYLLSRKENVLRTLLSDFTRSNVQTGLLEHELHAILDSAFVYPVGLALSNGTITLVLAFLFDVPYTFLATFILVFFTLVPMLGTLPTFSLVPFALATGLLQGVAFLVTHVALLHMTQGWEMKRVWLDVVDYTLIR